MLRLEKLVKTYKTGDQALKAFATGAGREIECHAMRQNRLRHRRDIRRRGRAFSTSAGHSAVATWQKAARPSRRTGRSSST